METAQATREDVTLAITDDPHYPQVCFDESPAQLTSEMRQPILAQPGQPARYDTEYKREGTANLFLQPSAEYRS